MKYLNLTIVLIIICILFSGCPITQTEEPGIYFDEDYVDYNQEIKLIFKGGGSIKTLGSCQLARNVVGGKDNYLSFSYSSEFTVDINDSKLKIPYKTVSCKIKTYSIFGDSKKILKINYPKTLNLNPSTAKIGDKVTITSTEPFFDKATFSKDKLDLFLEKRYHIVWIEIGYNDDKKSAVEKEYYVDVTSDSVTFTVPDYAKTGKVHVINECGFFNSNYYPSPLVVTKENAPAFFSTAEALVIVP